MLISIKKLLVFDVDGTLLDSQNKIPVKTLEALKLAKNNGHTVTIATGRTNCMLVDILKELDLNTYISFNGQYVVNKNDCIYKNNVNKDILDKIIEYGLNQGDDFVFQCSERMVCTNKNSKDILDGLNTIHITYPEYNPDYYKHNTLYQVLLFVSEEKQKIYQKLFPEVNFVRWQEGYCCDILPLNGSKSIGIDKLILDLGFTKNDVISFGDGLNDYEMIRDAGIGVAMGNGNEKLKEVADYIAPHVDDDGIYKIMKELKLF